MKQEKSGGILHYAGKNFLFPFILVTSCFALWGFANDITNPMVKAFSKIFRMSVTDGTLVQVAFYGGYFCMAFPAAAFIRKYSYKAGIMLGLALYATGALLFFPARQIGLFAQQASICRYRWSMRLLIPSSSCVRPTMRMVHQRTVFISPKVAKRPPPRRMPSNMSQVIALRLLALLVLI